MSDEAPETTRKSEHDFRFDCKPDFAYVTVQIPRAKH